MSENRLMRFASELRRQPDAYAVVSGSREYPNIHGTVRFYQTEWGVLVVAEVWGLPARSGECRDGIFAFHIHSGDNCGGNAEDPFADALTHYNPDDCPHPAHAGDLPPLFGNNGYALQAFLTNRFSVREILGRTVIIHSGRDDFSTQPAGNAGEKIACGMIRKSVRGIMY